VGDGAVSFDSEIVGEVAESIGRLGDVLAFASTFGQELPAAADPADEALAEFENTLRRSREEFGTELQAFRAALRVLIDDAHNADRWSG